MRRFAAFTIASCFVLALGPAAALARHHHPRHHRHHTRRMERFGTLSSSTTTTTTTSPTTSPTSAGTIKTFSGGVLTITLSDGTTTVSGAVTQDTEIECQSSSTTMGDDLARDDGPSSGGGDQGGDQGDDQGGDDQGGDDGGQGQSCDTTALTQGATVLGAELEITSSGAVWTKIELG